MKLAIMYFSHPPVTF